MHISIQICCLEVGLPKVEVLCGRGRRRCSTMTSSTRPRRAGNGHCDSAAHHDHFSHQIIGTEIHLSTVSFVCVLSCVWVRAPNVSLFSSCLSCVFSFCRDRGYPILTSPLTVSFICVSLFVSGVWRRSTSCTATRWRCWRGTSCSHGPRSGTAHYIRVFLLYEGMIIKIF